MAQARGCSFGKYLETGPDQDVAAVRSALSAGMAYVTLSMAMRKFGVVMAAGTISRHERGLCMCDLAKAQERPAANSLAETIELLRS